MPNLSLVRAKCYLLLQGIERALKDALLDHFDIESSGFLTAAEQDRALHRLRQDMEEATWGLNDVRQEDLLLYLDLGDLVALLGRHQALARSLSAEDIRTTSNVLGEAGVHAIRKRVMHPIRPLEEDDLQTLQQVATRLLEVTPSFPWKTLHEGLLLSQDAKALSETIIPPYWEEDPKILHNLPSTEFDDTGFIGRAEERRRLKRLLEHDRNVITVVGPGGVGKTALALRVCHDILEQDHPPFDRIVWVSLKTHYLTADGVRQITQAVDTTDALIDRLLSEVGLPIDTQLARDVEQSWATILEPLRTTRTLLVIDNLETLGPELRELAIQFPRDSKLLFTSRVGLGEIEIRYSMPDFSLSDATKLLRNLSLAYNYPAISRESDDVLRSYCEQLHHNPLLIKWFVQAVGRGVSINDVLSRRELGQALHFCWDNVLQALGRDASTIVDILLAARRSLTQVQLQEILGLDRIPFDEALIELKQSNIIDAASHNDGTTIYAVNRLVHDYLSQFHPPPDAVVATTRQKLRRWQQEQERGASAQNTYRYDASALNVASADQTIAAPRLRNALSATKFDPSDSKLRDALGLIEEAEQLTPQWGEVYRVKARVLECMHRPIYEIEQAYEEAIACDSSDVNRYHYATYLLRSEEYERASSQIEAALASASHADVVLRSTKGEILKRQGRLQEAIEEFDYVWNNEDTNTPLNTRRVHGTQYADTLRRRIEQLLSLGDAVAVETAAQHGINIADATASICQWDRRLAETGVAILAEVLGRHSISSDCEATLLQAARAWDSNPKFVAALVDNRKALSRISYAPLLQDSMPNLIPKGHAISEIRYRGTVRHKREGFGFIEEPSWGNVHMNVSSLRVPRLWMELRIGQTVSFAIIQEKKGPHAVHLELDTAQE